ncbi:copper resistance D family protein [Knoellia sp. CPCC 206435]|uniref:copper resistance D family protein n=1 Tax=Knoellia terrae TaxID=3404797 RepID=UPI003B42DCAD
MATSVDLEHRPLTRGPRGAASDAPLRRAAGSGFRLRLAVAAGLMGAGALVVAAVVGGAAGTSAIADPGAVTRWGLLVARTVYDVTAMGTIGILVVAVVLLSTASSALSTESQRLVRVAGRWSVAWVTAAAVSVPLTLSDVAGIPVWETLAPDVFPLAADLPQTRALLSSAWLAALVAVGSARCRSTALGWLLLVTGVGALLPLLLSGHTGHGDQQAAAVIGLTSHVLAAAVWVGGLLALGVHVRSADLLAVALPRYSRVALACFALVATSGIVMGWVALTEPGELLSTAYGQLLLGKTAALGALGALGHRQRRRALPSVAARRPHAFLRLAAVEIAIMVATAGLAVGLSRTAPPDGGDHAAAVTSMTDVRRAEAART